jgi:deoxyhypusine synthase
LIVDQDFFEALGYKHYIGTPFSDDHELRDLAIDRIYDTYIDEDELRVCDLTVAEIANSLPPRPFSSREFIWEMGKYLDNVGIKTDKSVIYSAYQKGVPIFVPAFSDCSAGFGLIHHQWNRKGDMVTIDSARDFLELTKIKIAAEETGILMMAVAFPKILPKMSSWLLMCSVLKSRCINMPFN